MLPVIVLVDGDMVLITPLADCEPAGSLIREPDSPFGQVCLVSSYDWNTGGTDIDMRDMNNDGTLVPDTNGR